MVYFNSKSFLVAPYADFASDRDVLTGLYLVIKLLATPDPN